MKFELLQSLRQLKEELDQGKISEEEYGSRRQAMLDEVEEMLEEDENTASEYILDNDTASEHLGDENTVSDFLDEQNTGVHLLDEDGDPTETLPQPQVSEEYESESVPARKGGLIGVLIALAILVGLLLWAI
jgi:hypothetical protein